MPSWFARPEDVLIPAQLVFAMLGMGATLSLRDFALVFKNPAGLALGLVLQLGMVPAIAVLLIAVSGMSEGWAVGLLLVAVVPGGAFSNLLTYLGKGNVPLSIALTTVSTLGCVLTAPAILGVLAAQHLPSDFAFPAGSIVRDIALFLLLPLAIGMAVLRLRPGWAPATSKNAIRLSVLLLIVIVASSLGTGRIQVAEYGWGPPLRIVLFGALVALVTPHASRLLGRFDDDTVALNTEVCIRNVGVGLLLLQFFFPDQPAQGHVLYTCLFYSGMSGALALPGVLRHRLGKSPVPLRRAHPRPVESAPAPTAEAAAS